MGVLIAATLVLSPVAGWVGRRPVAWARLLALWPLLMALWFGAQLAATTDGAPRTEQYDWVPHLGLTLSFRLDGLSGLFAVLIAGMGAVVVAYGAHYFDGHPYRGRFQATLFAFMAAMLGVVLTDNGLALFVFWELTGITSYLLIGFEHEKAAARRSALQALLVTGGGGLALLAGAVLLAQASGSPSLLGARVQGHPLYPAIAGCFLLAAFTKSAQFPFHFWLPNAMAAPTPVSAYLHSATMVKAGIYLVARMTPALGGTSLWTTVIVVVSGVTMLAAAVRALRETDLKSVLAYTTIAALGTMMFLLGLGTRAAVEAAVLYLCAHAAYKGALFLVTGIVDHETGTRDLTRLAGLGRVMPITAAAAALAAASMAGLPPSFGFLAKEQAYTAVLEQPLVPYVLVAVMVSSSALLGAAALSVGWAPFSGREPSHPDAHEPSPGLFTGAVLLAVLGLVGLLASRLSAPLAAVVAPVTPDGSGSELSLWHGFSLPLGLSAATLALTVIVYRFRARLRREGEPSRFGPERLYDGTLRLLDAVSDRIAPPLQGASLPAYALVFVSTTTALVVSTFFLSAGELLGPALLVPRPHEVLLCALIMVAAFTAVRARTTMTAVLSLGTAGYGVALTFSLYGAPDLAMTQFAVETLTAVIFVYVFWQFPRVVERGTRRIRVRDGLISLAAGLMITVLTYSAAVSPTNSRLRDFFARAAPELGHGRNVVNVILVDFRALDTLGEITVLATAAVGVAALLRIAAAERSER